MAALNTAMGLPVERPQQPWANLLSEVSQLKHACGWMNWFLA